MNTPLAPRSNLLTEHWDFNVPASGTIVLVCPREMNATVMTVIARLSSAAHAAETADGGWMPPRPGPRVIDCGNRFNAYSLARQLRAAAFAAAAETAEGIANDHPGGTPPMLRPGAGHQPEPPHPAGAMDRIRVARAFTCHQVLALLADAPATAQPFVVLDLLNTFYDEAIRLGERMLLLRGCIEQLKRLERSAGGLVSVHPPAVPSQEALDLLSVLERAIPQTYYAQPPAPLAEQMRLI